MRTVATILICLLCGCASQVKSNLGMTNETRQQQKTDQNASAGGSVTQTSNDSVVVRSLIRWGGGTGLAMVALVALMIWQFGYRPGNWKKKEEWNGVGKSQ